MTPFPRDDNRVPITGGVSSFDGVTPTPMQVDPSTGELLVKPSTPLLSSAKLNAIDDTTTTSITYFGKELPDGQWFIMKIDETGSFPVFTYATVGLNPTLTTYALGWAARTTCSYGTVAQAF